MEKFSLEETWRYCLEMWKWIAERWEEDKTLSVGALKIEWVKSHGFGYINTSCFFCEYCQGWCTDCPAVIVDKEFSCLHDDYNYINEPVEFYHKIVSLHEIFLGKEQ